LLTDLALYLFDAYAQAIGPQAAIKSYAQEILDDAYRRAFDTCGIRTHGSTEGRNWAHALCAMPNDPHIS
jgi:hypothetical protein